MPSRFYILMGCMVLLGVVGISVGILVGKKVTAKARRILAEIQRDDAIAQSDCMIRDGAIQCPGAAVIADGNLIVKSVFDKTRQIPLATVTVLKEGRGLGRFGWIGKRVFYLDTPETNNLAIGVKDPEPWRKAFAEKEDS